jgi:LL-diaminopimelate aminotransferase
MKVKPADRTLTVEEYYFSTKLKQIDEMRASGIDVINLGIGSPDMAPSENTINRLISEVKRPDVHGYQSYIGILPLRKAFAEWYQKYFNVRLDPVSEILPLMGSKEGIMHISMAFINPGDEVLVPDPGYPTYTSVTRLVGGVIRTYDLKEENGWLPDFARIESEDLSRVKMMWVNYPHMPSGTKVAPGLFKRLIDFGNRHNILICNDNPYSFILNNEYQSILSVEGAMEISLELNSLSKSHNMAGWRIGMIAGSRDYIKSILKVKSNMDSGMLFPLQMAAVEALGNKESWYDEINSVYTRRRKIAGEIMEILQCSYNKEQTGLFLWGRIPEKTESCTSLTDSILEKAHIFITPGMIFGKNGNRYIRISLCADEKTLLKAKERLVKQK